MLKKLIWFMILITVFGLLAWFGSGKQETQEISKKETKEAPSKTEVGTIPITEEMPKVKEKKTRKVTIDYEKMMSEIQNGYFQNDIENVFFPSPQGYKPSPIFIIDYLIEGDELSYEEAKIRFPWLPENTWWIPKGYHLKKIVARTNDIYFCYDPGDLYVKFANKIDDSAIKDNIYSVPASVNLSGKITVNSKATSISKSSTDDLTTTNDGYIIHEGHETNGTLSSQPAPSYIEKDYGGGNKAYVVGWSIPTSQLMEIASSLK